MNLRRCAARCMWLALLLAERPLMWHVLFSLLVLATLPSAMDGTTLPPTCSCPKPPAERGRTITVTVVGGELEDSLDPVPGATVTIVPFNCPGGCRTKHVGITNALGRVDLPRVDGPFTVTAQLDFTPPDEPGKVIRVAASLVDIDPSAASVTVPFIDENDDEATLDASIGGTLTNLPPLAPDQFFTVQATSRAGEPDFFSFGSVSVDPMDMTMGAYGIAVPAGQVIDVALVLNTTNLPSGPLEAVFLTGNLISPGINTRDVNYGASSPFPFFVFSTQFLNQQAPTNPHFISLEFCGPLGQHLEIPLDSGLGALPTSLRLPDITAPELSGFDSYLTAEQSNGATGEYADTTENLLFSDHQFDLLGVPSLSNLSGGLSMTDAATRAVTLTKGAGAGTMISGVNTLDIESTNPGLDGVDEMSWSILSDRGIGTNQVLDLPPTALTMFGSGGSFQYTAATSRFETAVDFDNFWQGDVQGNLLTLNSLIEIESEASIDGSFSTSCGVNLANDTAKIPVRLLVFEKLLNTDDVTGAVANRMKPENGRADLTLDCILTGLNDVFRSATGIEFVRASSDITPTRVIVPANLSSTGQSLPEHGDGMLNGTETSHLAEVIKLQGLAEPGTILLVPVRKIIDAAGNGVLGSVRAADCNSYPGAGLCCGGFSLLSSQVDNIVFVSDNGDQQTFAHEVGHALGLTHCVDLDNLMNCSRSLPVDLGLQRTEVNPRNSVHVGCSSYAGRQRGLTPAQIVQIHRVACDLPASLAPL